MELEELREKVEKQKEYGKAYTKKKLRENYAYAKSLGFTSTESSVLSKTSKETIYRLSQERKAQDGIV